MEIHGSHISAPLNMVASVSLIALVSKSLSNNGMTVDEIRRVNLAFLIAEAGGLGKVASAIGASSSQVSQWKNASPDSKTGKPRVMDSASARRLEDAFKKPRGWMDQDHSARPPTLVPDGATRLISSHEVPIIGTTQGGPPDRAWEETGYPVGHGGLYVDVATGDANAYGLRVVGDSMAPRIMEGEWIVVEPNTVPQPGDDVVVKTVAGEVMVKQLVAQHGDTVILASINEAFKRITRPLSDIVFIHYVGPRLPARAIKRRIESENYCGDDRRRETLPYPRDRRKE